MYRKRLPKIFKVLPNWWIFAKSGHTAISWSCQSLIEKMERENLKNDFWHILLTHRCQFQIRIFAVDFYCRFYCFVFKTFCCFVVDSVAILVSEILDLVSAKDFGIWLSIWYCSVSHLVSRKKSSIFFSIWSIFQFFQYFH